MINKYVYLNLMGVGEFNEHGL